MVTAGGVTPWLNIYMILTVSILFVYFLVTEGFHDFTHSSGVFFPTLAVGERARAV